MRRVLLLGVAAVAGARVAPRLAPLRARASLLAPRRETAKPKPPPPPRPGPAGPPGKPPPQGSLRGLLSDAGLILQLLKLSSILGFAVVRAGTALAAEIVARAFYKTVAVVELKGVIADDRGAHAEARTWALWGDVETAAQASGDGVVSVRKVERALDRAFDMAGARAVVLRVTSPGGTATESALLHARIASLKAAARKRHDQRQNALVRRVARFVTRKKKPEPPEVLAFVDELCTSGGYYAACAADAIVAAPCAMLGSVGVIQRGFGFHRAIRRDGVERRVLAAGAAKAGLDPYLPRTRPGIARETRILEELHGQFVGAVKAGRGDRLDPRKAADVAARADAADWVWLKPKAVLACWPWRPLTNGYRAAKGAGLFDGAVHGAATCRELGLVDDVVGTSFGEALKARYGRRIFIKTLNKVGRPWFFSLLPPEPGPVPF